jgi:hypothetical protein
VREGERERPHNEHSAGIPGRYASALGTEWRISGSGSGGGEEMGEGGADGKGEMKKLYS